VPNPPFWCPWLVPWLGLSTPPECDAAGARLALDKFIGFRCQIFAEFHVEYKIEEKMDIFYSTAVCAPFDTVLSLKAGYRVVACWFWYDTGWCYKCTYVWNQWVQSVAERKKAEYLYSAFYILCISQSGQTWILRKRSPDGATSNWGKRHPIAAYYSSIDPEGMKGWVGLVGWPIADGLPT